MNCFAPEINPYENHVFQTNFFKIRITTRVRSTVLKTNDPQININSIFLFLQKKQNKLEHIHIIAIKMYWHSYNLPQPLREITYTHH